MFKRFCRKTGLDLFSLVGLGFLILFAVVLWIDIAKGCDLVDTVRSVILRTDDKNGKLAAVEVVVAADTAQSSVMFQQTECEERMESAMRAKEEVLAMEIRRKSISVISVGDGVETITVPYFRFNEDLISYPDGRIAVLPDHRTPDQKLDDEEKDIKARRAALRKHEADERQRKEDDAKFKMLEQDAVRLWNDARACWRGQ